LTVPIHGSGRHDGVQVGLLASRLLDYAHEAPALSTIYTSAAETALILPTDCGMSLRGVGPVAGDQMYFAWLVTGPDPADAGRPTRTTHAFKTQVDTVVGFGVAADKFQCAIIPTVILLKSRR
jgi:hypothetical protein